MSYTFHLSRHTHVGFDHFANRKQIHDFFAKGFGIKLVDCVENPVKSSSSLLLLHEERVVTPMRLTLTQPQSTQQNLLCCSFANNQ
jgi:hypothetical protein